jgi:hypothetical protein
MRPAPSPFKTAHFEVLCRWLKIARGVVVGGAVLTVLASGAQPHRPAAVVPMATPVESSENVFQAGSVLPADLRRVAVLPTAWDESPSGLAQGGEMLGPLLLSELIKTRKFEVVNVTPEALRRESGRLSWTGEEVLPTDFLDSLQRVYGCEAVLFCELTEFRAYAPLAVGWRLKLVDARTHEIHVGRWTSSVRRGGGGGAGRARGSFIAGKPWGFHDAANDWRAAFSPRQFGQFTLAKCLSTLPNRKDMIKVSPPTADEPSRRWFDQKPVSANKIYGN